MTETTDPTIQDAGTNGPAAARKRSGGLSTMLLADLKAMAGGMGIAGAGSMKKAQLVEAIKAGQSAPAQKRAPRKSAPPRDVPVPEAAAPVKVESAKAARTKDQAPPAENARVESSRPEGESTSSRGSAPSERDAPEGSSPAREDRQIGQGGQGAQGGQGGQGGQNGQNGQGGQSAQNGQDGDGSGGEDGEGRTGRNRRRRGRDRNRAGGAEAPNRPAGNQNNQNGQNNQNNQNGQKDNGQSAHQGGNQGGNQGGHGQREPDTTILDDDVLVPAAGILDVLDNYAFVRTSGYLPGTDDVYMSLSMVRKFGLRRGDAIIGQVRQPREGERKEKFNPMVRIDGVNGVDVDGARSRPEFADLVPLHPSERLRMETGPDNLLGRVMDLVAPVGKGQRGLVVSPARAGKTRTLQSIAASVTANNPECHLMVVLVDERPEEVTEFERSVKGEVIASTFDRPPADHVLIAELAIERAKRLVELGHDVVVLLDGITRLGRAYSHATPVSGRVLSGGVDAAALFPAKRFFGAARNVENGGSLTILATAQVESGSATDAAIFEEFEGTGNAELRLRRDLAERRLFPAIDVVRSSTRREENLMSEQELEVVWTLRRTLSSLDAREALDQLLTGLRATQTNIEFLVSVQQHGLSGHSS